MGTFLQLVMVVISDISEQFLIWSTSKEVKGHGLAEWNAPEVGLCKPPVQ